MTRPHPHPPRTRATAARVVAAVGVVLAVLVGTAGTAAAHASLRSVDPADGSVLEEGPERVTLTFTEPVSADLGGVQVLDEDGGRVEEGAVTVDGATVSVGVQDDLADGTYVISYRVVSADGHPIRGATLFGVGDVELDTGAAGRVAADDEDRVWEVFGAVARGLAYAGILVAAGGAVFLAYAHRQGTERGRLVRLVWAAAIVGAGAALIALPVQAALATGRGPGALLDDGVLADVAKDGLGHSLLLGLAGLALVSAGVVRSAPAALVGALVAAGSFAATGHNRAGDTAVLATLADIAHLVAAAVWAGGLVALWLTLRWRRRDEAADAVETGRIVGRFSTLATGSIVVVGLAGLALGWSEVRALDALTDTTYGLLLLGKVGVVVAIAAMGAYNHFRLVPAFERGRGRAALARLRTTVRFEVAALVVVAALTSVLVVVTPAKVSAGGGIVERIVELGEVGSVQVVVDPATAGPNVVHLYTYDPDGRVAEIAESFTVELSLPSAGLGPIEVTPTRAGPSHFQLDGSDLSIAGEWQLLVRARVDRFTETAGTTSVEIRP